MCKWIRRAHIYNYGIITKLKLFNGKGCMTSAVDTGVTTITVFVFFERGTRTLVRNGIIRSRSLNACVNNVTLHGVSTYMHAIDRDGQHYCQENHRKKFQ